MAEITQLNLACGLDYIEGFWNIDDCSMFPDTKVDQKADILSLEWQVNSLDKIMVNHFAMYLRPEQMRVLLKRWHSWLKNGGKLRMETIDLKKVAKIVATEKDFSKLNDWGLVNLFGREDTGPHKWGWSPKTLTVALYQAGFTDVEVSKDTKKPDRDFCVIATK